MGNLLTRFVSVPFLHWFRLFGYTPLLLYLLYRSPLKMSAALAFYYMILSKFGWWNVLVKRLAMAGHDKRFHLIKHGDIDTTKQYLVCVHPHGVFSEGVLYSVVINTAEFCQFYPGFKFRSAAADQVAYLPLFRELTDSVNDKVLGVSKRELLDSFKKDKQTSIGIIPGGFSEAVFADARNTVEYSYLKGRKGFIKLAIEAKVDIVIVYQFGLNRLYNTPRIQRGFRARLAQMLALPMTLPFGWLGTNQPLDDTNVYTVVDGTPFPASQYSLDEIDKAHADYCAHLKRLYDTYKDQYNGGRPLCFIGKDFHDTDEISKAFRRLGVHTSHVIPGTTEHKQEMAQIAEQKRKLIQRRLDALEAQKEQILNEQSDG